MSNSPFLISSQQAWLNHEIIRALAVDSLWPIVRPSFSTIEGIEMLDIAVEPLLGELSTILLQSEIRKDSEPEPVGVWHTDKC